MRTGRKPTIEVNATYFETIDTEQKAYWLGFIYADGHVAQKAPWTVVLQSKDIEHVEQLAEHLGYTGTVKLVKGSGYNPDARHGRLVICRKKMCDDLNELERNAEVMRIPDIPPHLVRHFIRGYFDGDGSIYASKSTTKLADGERKQYSYLQLQIIGERPFLDDIAREFKKIGVNTTFKDSHTEYMKYLRVDGGNNLRKVHEYMYESSTVSLQRKADKWQLLYRPTGERSLV